jgi:putative acetyltransferase
MVGSFGFWPLGFVQMVMVTIRKEKTGDTQEIRRVNLFAFGREAEADVVDTLRESCPESISLVAVYDNQVVGHILFTPVTVETKTRTIKGMGLAPMAAMPECQRQGIGSQLVKAGLDEIERAGYPFVIVLGHPEYYPRFGFTPASRYRIVSEYQDVPDGAFMILVFNEIALRDASGVAKYRPEFAAAL